MPDSPYPTIDDMLPQRLRASGDPYSRRALDKLEEQASEIERLRRENSALKEKLAEAKRQNSD